MNPQLLLVSAIGDAQGARGAAGALACAASTAEHAALLIDLGARQPRPTLISSAAASALEAKLAATLHDSTAAARGQLCHLALALDHRGLAAAAFVRASLPEATLVIHLPHGLLADALRLGVLRPDGVLLRADLECNRSLAAETIRQLVRDDLPVAILNHRLNWVAERRALFGVLATDAPGALPAEVVNRLLGRSLV